MFSNVTQKEIKACSRPKKPPKNQTYSSTFNGLTSAGASVGGHDVSMRRTGTLVAASHIHTLEGTKVPNALGALINIC